MCRRRRAFVFMESGSAGEATMRWWKATQRRTSRSCSAISPCSRNIRSRWVAPSNCLRLRHKFRLGSLCGCFCLTSFAAWASPIRTICSMPTRLSLATVDATRSALIAGGELKDSSNLDEHGAIQAKSLLRRSFRVYRIFRVNIFTRRSEASA